MATVPSTLVIQTLDKNEFPINMAYVVMKQLFTFNLGMGLDISIKKGSVLISLSYTPKDSTLLKKMGNLPVKYTRIQVHSEEELGLLEKAVQKYNFNIINDDEIIEKRALEIEKPKQKSDIKILQDITLPSSSSSSSSAFRTYVHKNFFHYFMVLYRLVLRIVLFSWSPCIYVYIYRVFQADATLEVSGEPCNTKI
ncbi:hypothetical protein ABEB36_015157 [Hypothenemus hampei]|uniref:Uncharacterized protein n=1 Tax=Hypothenemus hampei TaxID=57062 RepID=A0ABD1E1I5_HYPHA